MENGEKSKTCCEMLEIKDKIYVHQKHCQEYTEGLDADKFRRALKGVELRWSSDQVLEVHPKRQIINQGDAGVNKKHIWLDPYFIDLPEDHPHAKYVNSVVVEWVLTGVTLVLARGFTSDPFTGREMTWYAVQEIKKNNERKNPRKPKPIRSRDS